MLEQLTLSIRLQDEANFQNFLLGDNEELIVQLQNLITLSDKGFIYLWGESGVGKSHLLQACCHCANLKNLPSFYLPLTNIIHFPPRILEGLDQFSLVCIDNLEKIPGLSDWEESLFHFYNKCMEKNVRLVISAIAPVKQFPLKLLDLQSRLAAGITYHLKNLSDEQKISALQLRAKQRGLDLGNDVGKYLLNHFPRNMTALFKGLDQLDQASLQAKHKLTIPFVKSILNSEEL